MEENLVEMTYVINGEKYLVTVSKVEDDVEAPMPIEDFPVMDEEVDDEVSTFNIADIPDGIDLATWLSIIDNYGIILTK